MEEEKCRNDVMISRVEEKGQDQAMISDLCTKLELKATPIGIMRVGHKSKAPSHHRMLKVSFANAFDARAFSARFDEKKKAGTALPSLRMRPGRTKQEQALFKRKGDEVHKLNKTARDSNANESFSLRNNGDIWRFTKNGDGKRVRDGAWRSEN